MTLYFVKGWQTGFETNETRKLKTLNWWPHPNKHDGLGFRKMAAQKNATELYCAWNLICDLASKTVPVSRRGYLERDGNPLTPEDMACCTGFPDSIFSKALSFFSSASIGWLCIESAGTPGESAGDSGEYPAVEKEGNGREKNGSEGNAIDYVSEHASEIVTKARIVLHWLNEQSGRKFREADSSLTPIIARLSEPEVTVEGCKVMVSRQTQMWAGSAMAEFLRPSTLFGKEKFNGYYAGRDCPIIKQTINGQKPHEKPKHEEGF